MRWGGDAERIPWKDQETKDEEKENRRGQEKAKDEDAERESEEEPPEMNRREFWYVITGGLLGVELGWYKPTIQIRANDGVWSPKHHAWLYYDSATKTIVKDTVSLPPFPPEMILEIDMDGKVWQR